MDNSQIIAAAEIRRQELAAELPKLTPAKSASQCLTLVEKALRRPGPRSIEEQEAEQLASDRRRLFAAAGCPARHANVGPNGVCGEWEGAFRLVKSKLGTGCIVALIGPRGTGKTQMAVDLIRAATDDLRTARYVKAIEVFVRIKGTYQSTARES